MTGRRQSDVSSKSYKLAGGSSTLVFLATAPGSGCTLDLFLATTAYGPSIEGAASVFPPAGPHDRNCRMDGRSWWDLHPSGGPLGYHQLQGPLVGHVYAPIVKRLVGVQGLARENPGPAGARGSIAWRRIDGQSRPKRQLKHTGAVRRSTRSSSR